VTDTELKFTFKLPARITGLVFWGLVFVGLLVAVIFLQQAEDELNIVQDKNARLLSYEIGDVLREYPQVPVLEYARSRLQQKIRQSVDMLEFTAVALNDGVNTMTIGESRADDEVVQLNFEYYPMGHLAPREIKVKVYYPNRKHAIAEMRKNILLGLGVSVIIFGLFLQRILQKILSIPFMNMVDKANEFSHGNEKVRFDEARQDEFGYLGKFINDAISSLLSHQEEMIVALARASSSEKELSIEKERVEVTLQSITDSVVTVDVDSKIQFINPAAESLLQITDAEAHDMLFSSVVNIVGGSSEDNKIDAINECFTSGRVVKFPDHVSLICDNATLISVEATAAPMTNEEGELIGAVVVIQDVSNTRKLTQQLSYQASHDMLTGLYNRRKFESHLEEVLLNVREENRHHVMFYIDLDQFKIVNDTCGHVAGDELLQQLPVIFNKVLRSGDLIARLGGDEFGVLLENCSLKQAAFVADKVREQIKAFRFIWKDKTFEIGVSIGVVAIDSENTNLAQIMSSADVACYAAKDAGRNRVHIYEASDAAVSERYGEMHWTSRITKAIAESRFVLYQQPIVGISDNTTEHTEVLIRMLDENGKVIPPGAFLPSAERYNLMTGIDRWVISEVFKLISDGSFEDSASEKNKIISLNLSGDSLNDEGLLEYIRSEKARFNISLENVCFEITETVAISNLSKATVFINELKKDGCSFALDDFGSGISSFTYLKTLPVNYLKIDGSFVRDVSRNEIDRAMVQSIQQIGEAMNLKTIAEWVEDADTLAVLEEIGIDYVQGNYLGRPELIPVKQEVASSAEA
jgi:diguanylate cyclase (GGDEF)-like protein